MSIALILRKFAANCSFTLLHSKLHFPHVCFLLPKRIPKLLSVASEIVVVRYALPFGLDVAPKNNLVVCTKDGKGGEKEGDILRYTSAWSIGLPQGDGLLSTAASFSGGVSWQCSLFDVMKAKSWEQVVEALTSNVEVRHIACVDHLDVPTIWCEINGSFSYNFVTCKLVLYSRCNVPDLYVFLSKILIQQRTDEVVLIFERPLEPAPELA